VVKIVICKGLAMRPIDEAVEKTTPPSFYLCGMVRLLAQHYPFRMSNSNYSSRCEIIVFEIDLRVEDSMLVMLMLGKDN
jgi:hypothetical protein